MTRNYWGGEVSLYLPIALYGFLPFVWVRGIVWWQIPLGFMASSFWRLASCTDQWRRAASNLKETPLFYSLCGFLMLLAPILVWLASTRYPVRVPAVEAIRDCVAHLAGIFARLTQAEHVDELQAEHLTSRWERTAEAEGIQGGSHVYCDFAWRWIAEQPSTCNQP
jgi:hypothetical protein